MNFFELLKLKWLGDGITARCHGFYCNVIDTAHYSEVSVFAPFGSPGVLDDPKVHVHFVAVAVSDDDNCVVGGLEVLAATVDVGLEVGVLVNAAFVVCETR